MRRPSSPRFVIPAAVVVPVVALAAAGFFGLYRPWHLRWGVTDEEVGAAIPGDGVVRSPVFDATRDVTVAAAPEAVWPWVERGSRPRSRRR